MAPSRITKTDLLTHIPANLPEELFEALFENRHVKIERIVSRGHRTPDDFWYDQAWDEWVLLLQGSAGLRLAGEADLVILGPGEALLIPAGTKHQVAWTEADTDTVWLAVHIYP